MSRFAALFLLAPVVLLAAARPAAAQTEREAPLADTLVVTAAARAEDARLAGQRVTVITAADIVRTPAASLDELLRTAVGVDVTSRGAFGVQSDLSVRGSTFGGVLVLIDGVRFNDPMTGHFATDFPIPLDEIARIEVLRGPAAARYGPDAVGGVVHILTRTAVGMPVSALTLRAGANGFRESRIAVGTGGAARLGLAAASAMADGETVPGLTGQPMRFRDGRDVRARFERRSYSAALASDRLFGDAEGRGAVRAMARYGYDDRDFAAVRFYTPFASDTAFEATTTHWAQLAAESAAEPGAMSTARTAWRVDVGARLHRDAYVYNAATAANRHTSRQAVATATATHRLSPALTVDAGVSGLVRGITSNNLGRHGGSMVGAFAQASATGGGFAGRAALRLDRDDTFGTEVTPSASVAYAAARWGASASAGRAVRAPSFVERYINTELARPRGRDLGTPTLEAERAWSADAGLDLRPLPGLSLRATAFGRRTDGLIDFVRVPGDSVFRAANLREQTVTGLETEADVRRGPVRLALAYTRLGITTSDLAAGATAKYALVNARHSVQATASARVLGAEVAVQSLWRDPIDKAAKAPRQTTAYMLHNVRVGYAVAVAGRVLPLSVEVRNIFDVRATEVFAPLPGRWWIVGLSLR